MKTASALFLICLSETVFAQTVTYPLHIGDRWQFWYLNDDVVIVGDTVMANGETYFIFENAPYFPTFQRYADNQVYFFDTETASDQLWYDFTLSPGDTVNVIERSIDTTIIFFEYSVVDTIFGVERQQWHFLVDFALQVIDDEVEFVVTDSLGVTEFCRCGLLGPAILRGAIIDGVQYGDVTSVTEDDTRPSDFSLYQNYPNPFNPTTTIQYGVPKTSHISLKVYDVLGREIATLVDVVQSPGEYTAKWDALGSSSGIYFYRLKAGGLTETRKLVLAR